MKKLIIISALISVFLGLSSCTPGKPYEITSPCVAGESDNPWAVNPCVRRPLNKAIV